jgi:hypothetical protein
MVIAAASRRGDIVIAKASLKMQGTLSTHVLRVLVWLLWYVDDRLASSTREERLSTASILRSKGRCER